MGEWSQKSDKDTAQNMSDRPAGSPTESCPGQRRIEALFVPPESVDLAARTAVPEEPKVESTHSAEPDQAIETSHTAGKEES